MTHFEDMQLQGLRDICNELKEINRNLNRIANSAIAVMPTENITIGHGELSTWVEKPLFDNSLCGNVNDCESVAMLRKIVEDRNEQLDDLREENENYRNKIHEYEKRLKDLIFNQGEPKKPIEKPYHKGMEVTTFGAK